MMKANFTWILFLVIFLSCQNNKSVSFYSTGEKKSEGFIVNSLPDGLWVTWHKNGVKSSEGYYNKGKKTYEWKSWSDKGMLIEDCFWQNNQLSGNYVSYYDDGSLKEEGVYSFGKRIFYFNFYDINGKKTTQSFN